MTETATHVTQAASEKAAEPAKPEPFQEVPGEIEALRASAAILSGAPPDDGERPTLLASVDGSMRQRLVHQMQRERGNAYVQRVVQNAARRRRQAAVQRAPAGGMGLAVQREGPPAGGAGAGMWGAGVKHSYKTPKLPVPINKGFAYIKLEKAELSGEFSYEVYDQGAASAEPAKASPTQARAGATGAPGEAGVTGELQHTFEDSSFKLIDTFTPTVKLGGELTTKGGEVAVEGGLEGQHVSTSLKFVFIGEDLEKGELEFATLTHTIEIPLKKVPEISLGGAWKLKADLKFKVDFKYKPDYIALGQAIAKQFATMAVGEFIIATAFIAGGVATIAAAVVTMGLGEDVRIRVDDAMERLGNYCSAYQAVMTDRTVGNPGGPGWDEGSSAAAGKLKEMELKVPKPILLAEARQRNLKEEAYDAGWPVMREKILEGYRKEHYVEWWVYGADGPGYRELVRVLDAAASAPGRR